MKQLLPWINNAKALFADPQKRNQIFHRLCGMALAVLITVMMTLPVYSQYINDDGNSHGVSSYQDLTLPNNDQILSISFNLKGGDGGYAQVTGTGGAKADGGQGAITIATFPVGSGSGQIPLGSTIRFVEGFRGVNGSSETIASVGIDYGGGGGGSAVLYKAPLSSGWNVLAVAGGGGGAYVGTVIGIKDRQTGQGGRAAAGNGSGGGGNIAFGGGGGGKNSGGGGVSCVDINVNFTSVGGGGAGGNGVGAGGYDEGCYNLTWHNGGAGYGGGGAGAGVGGGGGGYTGGAAGPTKQNGSGGGSYVSPLASTSDKTSGGTDGSPDNGSISYQVTLNQPPVAACKPATLILDVNGMATLTTAQINDGSSDPEDLTSVNLSLSKTNFSCSNVGDNTVSLFVVDSHGAKDTCQAMVTVVDNIDPVAVCQSITVYLDATGDASITADMIDNGSTDNCSIASKSLDVSAFTCADVSISPNAVTLTVVDPSGHSNDCNATVTVLDTVSPVAICQDITIQLDDSGNASILATQIDNGSNDACEIASLSVLPNSFICSDVGGNTVTLTVTDNNGNTSTCTSTVTVEDNVPPEASCQNITIQLDRNGEASIVPLDIDNGSNDACGNVSLEASKTDFTCSDLGNNNVVLTVTDVNGNSSTCNANVLVEDNLKPLVRTRNVTVVLDEYGEGYVTTWMINNGSTDNCTIYSYWLEGQTEYDCGTTGEHEVVLKARDQSGNIGSYNAFVTVKFYEPDFKNKHDLANGDTVHYVNCQVPWDISRYDLDYETINKHGTLTTHVYKEELPENAPGGCTPCGAMSMS